MIVFRVDTSIDIGSGHVMRCLTLADLFKAQGLVCHFICREHPGNMIDHIRQSGYQVHELQAVDPGCVAENDGQDEPLLAHSHWLGVSQQEDANECIPLLQSLKPDWLIVDHYAMDSRWENLVRHTCKKVFVIDDLADRSHDCDLLLDQNLGRRSEDYAELVPLNCHLLIGPQYALLRPEFAALRECSLEYRKQPKIERILITMGGVDKDNATGRVLEALQHCSLSPNCRISVVMGASAPWLESVRQQALKMPWHTEVLVNIRDMANRMAKSDLSIGAAGSTSWERCCLGLPALLVVLAENQWPIAQALQAEQAAGMVGAVEKICDQLPMAMDKLFQDSTLSEMSKHACMIADGLGALRVLEKLEQPGDLNKNHG